MKYYPTSIYFREIQKEGNPTTIGSFQYWVRFKGCNPDSNSRFNFMNENGSGVIQVGIYCNGSSWWFKADSETGTGYEKTGLSPETWYQIKLKWNTETDTYQVNFNDTGWSDDLTFLSSAQYIYKLWSGAGGMTIWYDDMAADY